MIPGFPTWRVKRKYIYISPLTSWILPLLLGLSPPIQPLAPDPAVSLPSSSPSNTEGIIYKTKKYFIIILKQNQLMEINPILTY
jgi:hypothetical protein